MKNIHKKLMLVSLVFMAAVFFMTPVSAEAKAGKQKLKINTTYTKYDFTGDKKEDKFLISAKDNGWAITEYSVFINGKEVFSKTSEYGLGYDIDVYRLELKNGKVFVAIIPIIDNGDIPDAAIYMYKNEKLTEVAPLDKLYSMGNHVSVSKMSVSGNKVKVKYSVMSNSLGSISFTLDYKYKSGKLVRATTKSKLTSGLNIKKWTANKKIKVYKSPNSKKKVMTLKKGQKVKIDKIYVNKKYSVTYLHVKTSKGKSGWIKGLKSYPKKTLFKEVVYAG